MAEHCWHDRQLPETKRLVRIHHLTCCRCGTQGEARGVWDAQDEGHGPFAPLKLSHMDVHAYVNTASGRPVNPIDPACPGHLQEIK